MDSKFPSRPDYEVQMIVPSLALFFQDVSTRDSTVGCNDNPTRGSDRFPGSPGSFRILVFYFIRLTNLQAL